MRLLSYERALLATYVVQTANRRDEILAEAIHNPQTSGSLIYAYRAMESLL